MTCNLGQTSLRTKRRIGNPMYEFDALPKPLRRWLNEAILPWSPISVRRIWLKSIKEGLSNNEVVSSLRKAEERTPKRENLMGG